MTCQITRLSKGNGKFRTIYNPDAAMRNAIASHREEITTIMMSQCDYRVCHGFMPGRGPVTNASYHIGYLHTLSMDLTDFFDTVTHEKLAGLVPEHILQACLHDGAARQGLPSSPALANIAAAAMDTDISTMPACYTRYADDLTLSCNDLEYLYAVQEHVIACVEKHGFRINPRKTKIQHHKGGRRIITGVAVDDKDVYCTRRSLRKARAAKHQGHKGSAAGLVGWMKHPHLICPICWTRHRDFFSGIYRHFRYNLPECCKARSGDVSHGVDGSVTGHWGGMFVNRGSIPDPADLYDHLREQYLIWSLCNG